MDAGYVSSLTSVSFTAVLRVRGIELTRAQPTLYHRNFIHVLSAHACRAFQCTALVGSGLLPSLLDSSILKLLARLLQTFLHRNAGNQRDWQVLFVKTGTVLPFERNRGPLKVKTGQFKRVRSLVERALCLYPQTEDSLKHKVRNRPHRADVVNMHILQGEPTPKLTQHARCSSCARGSYFLCPLDKGPLLFRSARLSHPRAMEAIKSGRQGLISALLPPDAP